MKDSKSKNMLQTLDTLMDSWDDDFQSKALDNNFPYIFSKAFIYLKKGPVLYRKDDFFHQPPVTLSEIQLEILANGCHQVLEGRGLTAESPFIDLNVEGFYNLFRLFHYDSLSRKTKHTFSLGDQRGILDAITFSHAVDGNEVTYFNFIKHNV
jgi:hypothetical protein